MTITTAALFVLGFFCLITGADLLVRGASRIAAGLGISPLIIGLTVVSFGTSAPELAVSLGAVFSGQPDLGVGNVVGSNICNVVLILGLSASIAPLVVAQQLVRLDVPLMIIGSVITWVLVSDGNISRLDGIILFAGALTYLAILWKKGRVESPEVMAEYAAEYGNGKKRSIWRGVLNVSMVLGGLGMLVLGSQWLVEAAVTVARALGVTELVIGLTIVALGTSLPELATSAVASLKGERDIAVGNVVGSNIFNLHVVLGLTGAFSPSSIEVSGAALDFDFPVMLAVSIACLPIFFNRYRIDRWEGVVFLLYYVAYITYQVVNATQPGLLPPQSTMMLWFLLPISIVTLLELLLHARWRNHQRAHAALDENGES